MRPSPVFLGIVALTIVGGALTVIDNKTAIIGGTFLLVIGGWGISLCLHEFGHAFVAYRGGDRSVYFKGYLTLDPRRYTDPVLSLLLPLLLLAAGGIPLPGGAVWINHSALRNRRVESWVSLAGPLANLAVCGLLILSVGVFFEDGSGYLSPLGDALSFLALLQILAFLLNILPVPGLDGWGAIEPYLSHRARELGAKARPWAPLVLFAVMIGIQPVANAFFNISYELFDLVGGNADAASDGYRVFRAWL